MAKILLIEDDDAISMGLVYYLKQEGFEMVTASRGMDSLKYIKDVSLVLLDVNLPDINGFELFKKIKDIKDVPVIFLTANDLEVSIVMGLDMGADDYVTKPFKAKELVSRIKTVLRRCSNHDNNNLIKLFDLTIDTNRVVVLKNGVDVMLTALEYKIFLIFVLNPNVVFTREKILANVWDVNEEYVNDNALTVYIKRIREKIEDDPANPKIIVTVRGIGYKLGDEHVKE